MATEAAALIGKVVVRRHGIGYRILHWSIVVTVVVLIATGLQIGGILGNVSLLPNGRAVHTLVGLVLTCLCILFLYYFVVTHEYDWYAIRRIPSAFRFFTSEAKAWLGFGPHVKEPILYAPDRGRYVEKIVPTEVFVWWAWVVVGALSIITGLALAFPEYFGFVYDVAGWLAPLFGGGDYALVRALHRFLLFVVVALALLHAYAAFVFRMLRSITFGDRAEPVEA